MAHAPFMSRDLKQGRQTRLPPALQGSAGRHGAGRVRREEVNRKVLRIGIAENNPALVGAALKAYRDDYSSEDIGLGAVK